MDAKRKLFADNTMQFKTADEEEAFFAHLYMRGKRVNYKEADEEQRNFNELYERCAMRRELLDLPPLFDPSSDDTLEFTVVPTGPLFDADPVEYEDEDDTLKFIVVPTGPLFDADPVEYEDDIEKKGSTKEKEPNTEKQELKSDVENQAPGPVADKIECNITQKVVEPPSVKSGKPRNLRVSGRKITLKLENASRGEAVVILHITKPQTIRIVI